MNTFKTAVKNTTFPGISNLDSETMQGFAVITGITAMGSETERTFCTLTGATKSIKKKKGDVNLEGHDVELKKASGGTANQVRAIRYIPLVIFSDGKWFVISPNEVVALVCHRNGQHGENPFENATISVSNLSRFETNEADLKQAVLNAVAVGEARSDLKEAMLTVAAEIRGLVANQKHLIGELLGSNTTIAA